MKKLRDKGVGPRISGALACLASLSRSYGGLRKEAIDIYDHIDKKELRESYLAHIPQLGV